MSFRFRLSTLLRVREIAEEKEERLLSQILNRMAEIRQELTVLKSQQADLLVQREKDLRQQMSAAELQMYYSQKLAMEEQQEQLRSQLNDCEQLRRKQMEIFEAAHRDREVLTELRDKELESFRYVHTHREQQMTDDNFIARRGRARH